MKSNLLMNNIYQIQEEYKALLSLLLPKLKASHSLEALDEINLFWIRHIDAVQLYLRYIFAGDGSYVFTAVTCMDFEDSEHLPFLLMGKEHVLDDPLSTYAEICSKMSDEKNASMLYEKIINTVEDNIKIIDNCKHSILILPLRLLNQKNSTEELRETGIRTFLSLFVELESLQEYFEKCVTIQDIMRYARMDINELVMFSEDDDRTLTFEQRYYKVLSDTEFMVDESNAAGHNFFILVYGFIQQAIDILLSCIEYQCIPYIRFPVALHYVSLLSENLKEIEHIEEVRYKMSVAFVVHYLCDKERLRQCDMEKFLEKVREFQFDKNLYSMLETNGIDKNNFTAHRITQMVLSILEDFYQDLGMGKGGSGAY